MSLLPEVVVYKIPTFASVDHFEPMQHYAAQIFALNSNFDGPPSDVVEFATPEGIYFSFYLNNLLSFDSKFKDSVKVSKF